MSEARKLMRLQTKARQQGGVVKPDIIHSGMCWAEVRIYTGSLFPVFVPCMKLARKGCRTCYWHRDREAAAQMLTEA